MIDFVEEAVKAHPALAAGAWADLGTGSGALAVGVARAVPQAEQVRRRRGCACMRVCGVTAPGCWTSDGEPAWSVCPALAPQQQQGGQPQPWLHRPPTHPHPLTSTDAKRLQVYAVDLSPTPLAYAAFNARRLGVGGRVAPLRGSWYEPLVAAGVRRLAGVVSNPPYIPAADMEGLQEEVGRCGAAMLAWAWRVAGPWQRV